MTKDFSELKTEFNIQVNKTRKAPESEKIDNFMQAYEIFKQSHQVLDLNIPTVDGQVMNKDILRRKVTTEESGSEIDTEKFEKQLRMMKQKVEELDVIQR